MNAIRWPRIATRNNLLQSRRPLYSACRRWACSAESPAPPLAEGLAGVASCRSPLLRKPIELSALGGLERRLPGRNPYGTLNNCLGLQGDVCLRGACARKG